MKNDFSKDKLVINYVPIQSLRPAEYNPRIWSNEAIAQLKESIQKFGLVDPLLINSAPSRKGIVVGGNFRLSIIKELGFTEVPTVFINLPNLEQERELCIRLNKNTGEFDWSALADFGEEILKDIGFSSEEMDNIFKVEDNPEVFDLVKELKKLDINKVKVQKGDIYALGKNRLMCGDSTIEADILKLMNNEKADFCLTDEPYILDYLHGKKRKGKATEGFGYKRDRKYLETDSIPDDFVEKWMNNIAKVQKPDFSIIAYEHPKNLRTLWNELEKHWKYRNTIIWHLPNRVQGFAGKYKLFNKYDLALVGTSGNVKLNLDPEHNPLLQEDYEAAIFATSGHPYWESYAKGKKYCPTDHIDFKAADEKSSGQAVIFGTKPVEILIPYIKILTRRDDLIIEPFCGSGSTLIAAQKMNRRCYAMEKVPTYCEVIIKRWERLTGLKAQKLIK